MATNVTSGMPGTPIGVPPGGMVPPFSEADLLAFSAEHVAYEVKMFFAAEEALSMALADPDALKPLGDRTNVTYALMESFVLHLRNLDCFLFDDQKKFHTDVLAIDFFASPTDWIAVRPPQSSILVEARERANRELAHLTSHRIFGYPPKKAWNCGLLVSELRPILRAFVAKAMSTRLSPAVGALIR